MKEKIVNLSCLAENLGHFLMDYLKGVKIVNEHDNLYLFMASLQDNLPNFKPWMSRRLFHCLRDIQEGLNEKKDSPL